MRPTLSRSLASALSVFLSHSHISFLQPDFYWTSSRSSSPFPGTTSVRPSHPKEPREGENARRDAAAVGILNALNPQFSPPLSTNVDATTRSLRDDETLVYAPSEGSIREENRERGGFWVWSSSGGERDRDRRDREEGPQDLMRMIGIKQCAPTRSLSLTPPFFLRLPHRYLVRGLGGRARCLRACLGYRSKRQRSGKGSS